MPPTTPADIPAHELDRHLYPLTNVLYTGTPSDETPRRRLVRLPPREAVAWCVASHVHQPDNWKYLVQHVKDDGTVWSLGDYYAAKRKR